MRIRGPQRLPPAHAIVSVESGGSHQFDLGHLRRQGAVDLVRLLIQTGGYRQQRTWRVRVEKKISCGAQTLPVTVVSAKAWCCYLKVKPGDNDTAHFCSLLVPDGYRGEAVYEALKDAEERVNRAWRDGFDGEVVPVDYTEPSAPNGPRPEARPRDPELSRLEAAREAARLLFDTPPRAAPAPAAAGHGGEAPEPVPEAAAPPEADEPAGAGEEEPGGEEAASELLGWTQDLDKVRLTLLAIHEVNGEAEVKDQEEFVSALAAKLGWEGLRRKQIGGIFTAFMRRGYVCKRRRGDNPRSQPVGYALTAEGRQILGDVLPPHPADEPPAAAAPVTAAPPVTAPPLAADPAGLTAALTRVVGEYTTACQRFQENRARRAQLLAEVERLDAEADELGRVVNDPEVRALLQRLVQLTDRAGPAGRAAR